MNNEFTSSIRMVELECGRSYLIERSYLKIQGRLGALPRNEYSPKIKYTFWITDDRMYISGILRD